MSEEQPTPNEGQPEPPPLGQPEPPPVGQPESPPVGQPPRPVEIPQDYSQPPQYFQPQPNYYQQNQAPSTMDRIIPTKNPKALFAYYCGVFSIIPCIGLILGAVALVLGILGLKECKRDANLPGKGHAITGIVLGSITFLANAAVIVLIVIGSMASRSST